MDRMNIVDFIVADSSQYLVTALNGTAIWVLSVDLSKQVDELKCHLKDIRRCYYLVFINSESS